MGIWRETAYRVSVLAGLTRAATRLVDHKAVVLAYHDVDAGGLDPILNFDGMRVRVARFERQMRYLAARYHVVPLDDLLSAPARPRRGKPLAAITFDDGYRDTNRYAVPILRRLSLPATVFIVTDVLLYGRPFWWDRLWAIIAAARRQVVLVPVQGTERPFPLATADNKRTAIRQLMRTLQALPSAEREDRLSRLIADLAVEQSEMKTWDPITVSELRDLAGAGISIGSHGRSHESFLHLSPAHLREELCESKQVLEALTDRPVTWLSYPYGDFSREVAEIAAQAGYRGAVTTIEGLNDGLPDPFAVRRFGVDDRLSFAHFRVVISGLRDVLAERLRTRGAAIARPAVQLVRDETRS